MAASRNAVTVIGRDGDRPFMRGIVVQTLVARGVPFEVALETANRVRDTLEPGGRVHLDDLEKMISGFLGDRFPLDAAPLVPERRPPMVRTTGGGNTPFSKGILAVSLQGAGIDTAEAYQAALELEQRLLLEGQTSIGRNELRDLVADTLSRAHGPRSAERYLIWRRAREEGKPIFILVGGSTGVGKTSIAVELARRLEISHVIGTDSIRQIMRLMFSEDLMPEIHASTYDAFEALDSRSLGEGVITAFRDQAQKICVGVHALLDRAVEENTNVLIEGVNLLPSLLDLGRYVNSAHVIQLVVATLDPEAWQDRFETRAAVENSRAASRYLEHFDQIQLIQDHILQEADLHGLQIIDNTHLDDAAISATRSVIAALKKSQAALVQD